MVHSIFASQTVLFQASDGKLRVTSRTVESDSGADSAVYQSLQPIHGAVIAL